MGIQKHSEPIQNPSTIYKQLYRAATDPTKTPLTII
nr:MAG TPA: hypothetical protein [Inoviridae sp.]